MRHCITRPCCVFLALAAALSGCGVSDSRRFFLLEAERPERLAGPPKGPILAVMRLQMSPRYREKELVYRTSEFAHESDYYNLFLNAAGALIAEQTRRWLGRAGIFAAVVNAGSNVMPTHVIEGNVTALYGDFRDDDAPKGVLAIEYFVIDAADDTGARIVFHQEYEAVVDLSAGTAEALVKAYNDGLVRILGEFEKDLRRSLAAAAKAP